MDLFTLSLILVGVLFLCLALGLWVGFSLIAVGLVAMMLATARAGRRGLRHQGLGGAQYLGSDGARRCSYGWARSLFRSRLSSDLFTGSPPFTPPPARWAVARQPSWAVRFSRPCRVLRRPRPPPWGAMSLPELKARGYDDRMAIGTLDGLGHLRLSDPAFDHPDRLWRRDRAIHRAAVSGGRAAGPHAGGHVRRLHDVLGVAESSPDAPAGAARALS